MVNNHFQTRKGRVGSIFVTLFCGFLVILVGFLFVLKPPEIFSPFFYVDLEEDEGTTQRPLVTTPKNESNMIYGEESSNSRTSGYKLSQAMNDLISNNCTIISTQNVEAYNDEVAEEVDYKEFKEMAIRSEKVILYEKVEYDSKILIVRLNDSYYSWTPDETRYEEIEIVSIDCSKKPLGWKLKIKIKNNGATDARIMYAYINGIEVSKYGVLGFGEGSDFGDLETGITIKKDGLLLKKGQMRLVTIYISDRYAEFESGETVNVTLKSGGGMGYMKSVELN